MLVPVTLITRPYLDLWRRLPLRVGGFDMSYLAAFYGLSIARRELLKTKYRRQIARYRRRTAGLSDLYA